MSKQLVSEVPIMGKRATGRYEERTFYFVSVERHNMLRILCNIIQNYST
jgi:hypothetical protein